MHDPAAFWHVWAQALHKRFRSDHCLLRGSERQFSLTQAAQLRHGQLIPSHLPSHFDLHAVLYPSCFQSMADFLDTNECFQVQSAASQTLVPRRSKMQQAVFAQAPAAMICPIQHPGRSCNTWQYEDGSCSHGLRMPLTLSLIRSNGSWH